MNLIFEDWGLIDYQKALEKQQIYLEERRRSERGDTLIFGTHPPVVTLGRATTQDDLCGWQGQTVEVSRGGRATYHGPSQLVIYPIYSLKQTRKNLGPNDVGGFLRDFENAIVMTLHDINIKAVGKSLQKKNVEQKDETLETGVWVGHRKIASLGIGVRHWVTFHGAALNVEYDSTAFQGLKPCGFNPDVMISVEEILGAIPDRSFIKDRFRIRITESLFGV